MKKIVNGISYDMTPEEIDQHLAEQAAKKPRVPEMVTMFQARAALINAGLFDAVHVYCESQGGVTWQAWEYANHCYRHGALVTSLGPQFGLSHADLDALFIAAERIEA